ncbi:MAG: hypothetical protein ABH800_01175 [Candidatus Nealsonbacteria bacterium]
MEKEIIKDKDQILAMILRNGDFPEGMTFHTNEEDFIQVATWNYKKGKRSSFHSHNIVNRVSNRSQEAIYIKKGKIKFWIYTEEDKLLKEIILNEGDFIIVFGGGHGLEVLEEGTQAFEIKNGPYPGLEKDRRLINE